MGNLRKAQRLDFANNHILKVPPVIGHLKALKELNLRYAPSLFVLVWSAYMHCLLVVTLALTVVAPWRTHFSWNPISCFVTKPGNQG